MVSDHQGLGKMRDKKCGYKKRVIYRKNQEIENNPWYFKGYIAMMNVMKAINTVFMR
jgi:hypothetical protein